MTHGQLLKALQKDAKKHGTRAKACVDLSNFRTRHNGVFDIEDLFDYEIKDVKTCDGDGFAIVNKNGSERYKKCLILYSLTTMPV